jgi:hypothetical protein
VARDLDPGGEGRDGRDRDQPSRPRVFQRLPQSFQVTTPLEDPGHAAVELAATGEREKCADRPPGVGGAREEHHVGAGTDRLRRPSLDRSVTDE